MLVLRLLPIAFALTACGGSAPPPRPEPMAPFPAPERLYYDNTGGITDHARTVIRDRAEFERVWGRATSRQASPPPPPAIAFESSMVVLVGSGRMTPGALIAIDSVGLSEVMNAAGEMEETLTIIVLTTHACQRFNADTYPLEISRLRRFDGPVRWEERVENENCRQSPAP